MCASCLRTASNLNKSERRLTSAELIYICSLNQYIDTLQPGGNLMHDHLAQLQKTQQLPDLKGVRTGGLFL